MKQETKLKLTGIVKMYIDVFSSEFDDFKIGIAYKRGRLKTKFAEMKGSDLIERELYEIPETLFQLITSRLDVKELEDLRTKDGARWFAKTFPAFRISEKV